MTEKSTEMSIWMHLEDLRKRLLFSLITLFVGIVISMVFMNFLLKLVARPIGGFDNLLSIQVTENLNVFFRISLLSGFVIAFPFILVQLYLFIAPGLSEEERRWVSIAVPLAITLFVGGAAFAYFVMLPAALPFLTQFPGPNVLPKWTDYVSFITSLIFWIGISFETPLVMYLLAKLGVVTASGLLKQWRIAIIGIAVIAAVVTPTPDPINMVILMIPLLFLYFFGILLASFARR